MTTLARLATPPYEVPAACEPIARHTPSSLFSRRTCSLLAVDAYGYIIAAGGTPGSSGWVFANLALLSQISVAVLPVESFSACRIRRRATASPVAVLHVARAVRGELR